MRDIVLELLSSYGYAGMFALILIENLFPPIPSEVILTFGGFMTTYTRMNIAGAVLAATAGSVLGASWERILVLLKTYSRFAVMGAGILGFAVACVYFRKR